ncbi:MAG: hypothetical protein HQL57_00800 [Magnetococcales bacterium]|nr:hypothetical protein [Magnetococcales bacterium]MBF0155710.1 hypothetical protein [Magnetococcales bacterium]
MAFLVILGHLLVGMVIFDRLWQSGWLPETSVADWLVDHLPEWSEAVAHAGQSSVLVVGAGATCTVFALLFWPVALPFMLIPVRWRWL